MGDARVGVCLDPSNLDCSLFRHTYQSVSFPGFGRRSALTALRAPQPGLQRPTVFSSAIIARPRTGHWACISLSSAPLTWTNGLLNNS